MFDTLLSLCHSPAAPALLRRGTMARATRGPLVAVACATVVASIAAACVVWPGLPATATAAAVAVRDWVIVLAAAVSAWVARRGLWLWRLTRRTARRATRLRWRHVVYGSRLHLSAFDDLDFATLLGECPHDPYFFDLVCVRGCDCRWRVCAAGFCLCAASYTLALL